MKKTGRKITTVTVAALTLVAALAPSPGDDVLAAQEQDSTTFYPVPPSPPGPKDEEKLYGPSSVPGCDLDFAVLAATMGEPSTVRECPRADGGRDACFFLEPVVAPRRVDTVATDAAGDGGWKVVDDLLPRLGASPVDSEVCLYTDTPERDFLIDRLPGEGAPVVVASGFSGHGFKFAPVVAGIAADLITGPPPDVDTTPFRLGRWRD